MHNFRCLGVFTGIEGRTLLGQMKALRPAAGVRCHLDIVTIAVVGVILVSYIVGSLTSSVETEQELPHRY